MSIVRFPACFWHPSVGTIEAYQKLLFSHVAAFAQGGGGGRDVLDVRIVLS